MKELILDLLGRGFQINLMRSNYGTQDDPVYSLNLSANYKNKSYYKSLFFSRELLQYVDEKVIVLIIKDWLKDLEQAPLTAAEQWDKDHPKHGEMYQDGQGG